MTRINGEGEFVSNLEWPPERRIAHLGRLLAMCNEAFIAENEMHEDVRAWSAPSECHGDVARGCQRDYLALARLIEDRTGFTPKEIAAEAVQRLGGRVSYRAHSVWLAGISAVIEAQEEEASRINYQRINKRLATSQSRHLR